MYSSVTLFMHCRSECFLLQGMGLSLCQTIVQKLDGDLRLDPDYHSGVEGAPGVRFVISLQKPVLTEDAVTKHTEGFESNEVLKGYITESESTDFVVAPVPTNDKEPTDATPPAECDLPESLSVLFVDDDPMLRKVSLPNAYAVDIV